MSYELGVIGGMGSLATSVFFDYVVNHTVASKDQDHINSIVLNHASMPDRTTAIVSGKYEDFFYEIKKDFALLNPLPLKCIAIPCNTSHFFYDDFLNMTHHPIINMVEETIREVHRQSIKDIVVFATTGTIQCNVYTKYAEKYNIHSVPLEASDAKTIMDEIYHIKATNARTSHKINGLIDKYSHYGKVILACTELSTLHLPTNNTLDALKILGNKAIKICNREVVL